MTFQGPPATYRFDSFRLDTLRGTLHGPDGAELKLRPKAFALLHHMLRNPGRLLPREELLDAIWPGVAVTDDSLTQCIGDLRRAFGARASHVLQTLPRRGYMLAAPVQQEAAEPPRPAASPPPPRPMPAPGIARRDTLVILPPETPPGDAAAARFAAILFNDLTAELVRFEDLRVVAGPDDRAAEGFRIRGEAHVAAERLHATLRLDDLATGTVFWAERIEQPLEPSVSVPGTAIIALASAIDVQIGRKSLRRARQKPPEALTARQLCLLGRELHQRGTQADTSAARWMFVRSATTDPDYAPAYAWHAFTVMRIVTHGWSGMDWQEAREQAVRLARRAVELEPDSPLCLSALAFALALRERWEEAVQAARLALQAGRAADYGTRAACGEVLSAAGEPEEAVAALRQTLVLDPHAPPRVRAVLGRALLLAGRPEEALAELRWCAAHLPDYAPCFRTMVVAAFEAGQAEEACHALREVTRLLPDWVPGQRPIFWFLRRPHDIERFEAAFQAAMRLDAAARTGRLMQPGLSRT